MFCCSSAALCWLAIEAIQFEVSKLYDNESLCIYVCYSMARMIDVALQHHRISMSWLTVRQYTQYLQSPVAECLDVVYFLLYVAVCIVVCPVGTCSLCQTVFSYRIPFNCM